MNKPGRSTNNERKENKEIIYEDIRLGLKNYSTKEFIDICLKNNLAVSPVNDVKQVSELDYIKKLMVKTILPNGKEVELCPAPMNTEFLNRKNNVMTIPPRLGEQNEKIFKEAGITKSNG